MIRYKIKETFEPKSLGFIEIFCDSQGLKQHIGLMPVMIENECQEGKAVIVHSLGFQSYVFPMNKTEIFELY